MTSSALTLSTRLLRDSQKPTYQKCRVSRTRLSRRQTFDECPGKTHFQILSPRQHFRAASLCCKTYSSPARAALLAAIVSLWRHEALQDRRQQVQTENFYYSLRTLSEGGGQFLIIRTSPVVDSKVSRSSRRVEKNSRLLTAAALAQRAWHQANLYRLAVGRALRLSATQILHGPETRAALYQPSCPRRSVRPPIRLERLSW